MSERRILHIDMDAFFAAIEQRDNPMLRGKPVIIGGPDGRGVASTCSYEARKFGVRSAMPIAEAKRLCPQGIYISPKGDKYAYASVKMLEILQSFSPRVEPVSIDEAYLDISSTAHLHGGERALGIKLKGEIYSRLRLTCSVGIAPTRVFAKMSSEMQKPDGLTIILRKDIAHRIYSLPIEKIAGVGEKSAVLIRRMGIETIGDLAGYSRKVLRQCLGVYGESLSRRARGESGTEITPLQESEDEKSIGHEHTLSEDTKDMKLINRILLWLSGKTGRRLRKKRMMGRIVVVKLRYSNFLTMTHRRTLHDFIIDEDRLFSEVKKLFNEAYQKGRELRLLGISVSGLVRQGNSDYGQGIQADLFSSGDEKDKLNATIDFLKDHHGEGIIKRAATVKMR